MIDFFHFHLSLEASCTSLLTPLRAAPRGNVEGKVVTGASLQCFGEHWKVSLSGTRIPEGVRRPPYPYGDRPPLRAGRG